MDIPYLRNEFINEKQFLHFLYSNTRKNADKISKASDRQLNILIKICHLISSGGISIRDKDFNALKASRRLNLFTSLFDKRDNLLSILSASKETKIKELKKFVTLFPHLLYTMFNKD